jgi:alkylation response protein AidB-like acyl-CoA dehydrogenase
VDFGFSEEQEALRSLAREILTAEVTPELLKEVEAGPHFHHPGLWSALAEANLLGLAVPEALSGMGFGLLELCVLLEEIGRAVAPVPVFPTLVLGGLAIERWGTEAQKQAWLEPMAAGDVILTGALAEPDSEDPTSPRTAARREGGAWILEGVKQRVPAAALARRILTPARTDQGVGLFLVDPEASGVGLTSQRLTNREPVYELTLSGVRVPDDDLLGGELAAGGRALGWMRDCALVGTCALQLGVSSRALEITTDYAKEREQFGAPIGSFPAVQQRAADCFVDLEAMHVTLWHAAWKLHQGEDAARETMVAKFWAAEAGSRIASAAQHLHGGIGVDFDYPIHRYFIWSKALELAFGGASPQLARLGNDMALRGPQESL